MCRSPPELFIFFFFNDTATTEIYTLSLHDALPISAIPADQAPRRRASSLPLIDRQARNPTRASTHPCDGSPAQRDRKSTRLNSSHQIISYAVFCLKKKKKQE